MTKLIFEVSEQTHAVIRLMADSNDESMRDFVLKAIESEIAKQTKISTNLRDKKPMSEKELVKISELFVKSFSKKTENNKKKNSKNSK